MTAYDDVVRTIIEVPDSTVNYLDLLAGQEGKSRAALVREALDEYLAKKQKPAAEAAYGLWKISPKDGVAYQEELRGEWSE